LDLSAEKSWVGQVLLKPVGAQLDFLGAPVRRFPRFAERKAAIDSSKSPKIQGKIVRSMIEERGDWT
jgi:hypothetical protein